MKKISKERFYSRQPGFPKEYPSDAFYYQLCNILKSDVERLSLLKSYPENVIDQSILCAVGYYQDIIADAGLWRSFVDAMRKLYGRDLPFYDSSQSYVEYELNRSDVRFVVWYALCMYSADRRVCNPFDSEILKAADAFFERFDALYEDAPTPEDHNIARHLELTNEEDKEEMWHFANWLFLHSFLLPPAFALTLSEILSEPGLDDPDDLGALRERIEKAMYEDSSGPLALYIGEWMKLIVEGEFNPNRESEKVSDRIHPYYASFTGFTGGKEIAFFSDYDELNNFFIEALGWDKDERHLSQLENDHDFILLVNKEKGMLLAKNIAKCVASPDNPLYDREYASKHAIDLLTVRGLCPHDLLQFIHRNKWLPDASFPGSDDNRLVSENFDFIARCYLQQYYRGD